MKNLFKVIIGGPATSGKTTLLHLLEGDQNIINYNHDKVLKLYKKIIQRVHPALVKSNSYIAKINGVLNAVIVESKPVGQSVLQGEGAGPGPTTSSLVSDLCSILRGNIKFPFVISDKKRKNALFEGVDNKKISVYLRLDVKDKNGILSDIAKIMAKNKISIKRLIQNPTDNKKNASIIIITHHAKSSSFVKILSILKKKNYTINKPKLIRIEDFR